MSSMEGFIVIVALASAGVGCLILLSCLAGDRARLIKAFNVQQELESRRKRLEQERAALQKKTAHAPPVVSGASAK